MRICLFLLGCLAAFSSFAQGPHDAVLSPALLEQMESRPEDAFHEVFFLLADRVDVEAMDLEFSARRTGQPERVATLLTALQEKADKTQVGLLEKLQGASQVKEGSIQRLWITNIVYASVQKALLEELSRDPAIEMIGWNAPLKRVDVEEPMFALPPPPVPNGVEPGLWAINAPFMWDMGYTGYGQKGYIIDSGVDLEHPALLHQYNGTYFPQSQSWYQPNSSAAPADCEDHGTHVTGTVMGLNRLTRDTIGVAFNAKWMGSPAIGCENFFSAIAALQWGLNPDQNVNTTADMPAVVNNSWYDPSVFWDCNSQYVSVLQALEAAGVAVVFSAGNEGPNPQTITPPHNINVNLVNTFTVGALNGNSSTLLVADFSSRGPSQCGGAGSLLIKPEVSAPGVNVRSAITGGGYGLKGGTSMAAPHVSGAILLLKEAFPNVLGKELKEALYFTCTDLGPAGEDNDYGMGIINLEAAFNYLLAQGHIPADPQVEHDVLLVDASILPVNCDQSIQATVLVENAGAQPLTSFSVKYGIKNVAPTTFTWTGLLAPGERTTVSLPAAPVPLLGDRTIQIDVDEPNGLTDGRPLNNRMLLKTRITDRPTPEISIAGGVGPVCEGSSVVLLSDVEPDPSVQVQWYDAPVDGNLLGAGYSYPTGPLASSTSFFAGITYFASVGKEDAGDGPLTYDGPASAVNNGLIFDAFQDFRILSVKVISNGPGWRFVKLRDSEGMLLVQRPVFIEAAGEVRIDLDIPVSAGLNHRLVLDVGAPLGYLVGGTNFPYQIEDVVSIKRSTFPGSAGSTAYYHYFFDWEIEYPEVCGRSEILVEVDGAGAIPAAAFSASADSLALVSGMAMVSFADNSTDASSWFWSFGDGGTSTEQNPAHTYTAPGEYLVTLTVQNGTGCSSVASLLLKVEELLTAIADPEPAEPAITLFPNPASTAVTIRHPFPVSVNLEISLIDPLGRVVKTLSGQQAAGPECILAVDQLPEGIYFVVFRSEGKQYARRLVVTLSR